MFFNCKNINLDIQLQCIDIIVKINEETTSQIIEDITKLWLFFSIVANVYDGAKNLVINAGLRVVYLG